MSQTFINPAGLHDPIPYGYSHTAIAPADRSLVVVSGQYGSDETGAVVSSEFADQVEQAFANLATALSARGCDLADVIQLRTYVVGLDVGKLSVIGQTVGTACGATPPTQTVIGVAALAMPDILFEVEAIAVKPAR